MLSRYSPINDRPFQRRFSAQSVKLMAWQKSLLQLVNVKMGVYIYGLSSDGSKFSKMINR